MYLINSYSFGGGAAPVDTDAQAFITAASITDPTQQSAINTLVTDLKGYGIWTKIKAAYPFVGGTASSHKFNLKDPQDTDAAFRLIFNGGVTHSSNGILGNGTNGYADTKFIPKNNFTSSTDRHLSFYLRTNNQLSGDRIDIGTIDNGTTSLGQDLLYNNSLNTRLAGVLSTTLVETPTTDSKGFSFVRKIGADQSIFKNGTKFTTTTGTGNSTGELPIWICGISLGSTTSSFFPYAPTNNQFAFASIGDGLTDLEASNFYTAVQAFQTTLGRQV